jgi:hypothetical protein
MAKSQKKNSREVRKPKADPKKPKSKTATYMAASVQLPGSLPPKKKM